MRRPTRRFHAKGSRLLLRALVALVFGLWADLHSLSVGMSSSLASPALSGLPASFSAMELLVPGAILTFAGGLFGLLLVTGASFVTVGPEGVRTSPIMRAPVPWNKIKQIERISSRLRFWRKGTLLITVQNQADISYANRILPYFQWNRGGKGMIAIYPPSFRQGHELAQEIALYQPIVSRQILWRGG